MSTIYNVVKRYYDSGRYTKENVAKFVTAGRITKEEYQLITGELLKE